ncbi:Daunorubicin/doxorubicin resistance ATP-binding protein DrrA [Nocardia cerradoensis]|uniref:Daunorubicin/doxorubicin resistance ATP-binding protein DrrA n=1 Tax=Nocardia cerradoensis TaxID=85688 RepID=A0A231H828_9NOCA|nr:ATP-binding cassette domain-containing protein [Nocardia cerradoensis]OXR45009.1 Daunorubicin/doxorubicin resistance ATP-binding protein DrrA [Nocardia cerradoensis]
METTATVRDRTRTSAIRVRGLARTFTTKTGPVRAVNGLDFEVREGEIVGLLGPNGAGKTTTLRMIATLLAPTAGEAQIADADLRRAPREVRARIGYVAQGGMTNDEELVIDQLVLQARLFGLGKAQATESAEHLLRTLELDGLGRRRCRELSGGQRRRVDIALGLVHRPRLVYLDEPTTGLDPQSRANLWDHVRRLRSEGTTIVLTTHYLEEADALCDRILVMDHGGIVASGTPDELKQRISGDVISLDIADAQADLAIEIADSVLELRSKLRADGLVHLTVARGDAAVVPLLRALDEHGIVPGALTVKRPSLDDVFLTVTGRSLREGK